MSFTVKHLFVCCISLGGLNCNHYHACITFPPLLVQGVFLRWNRSSKCLDEAYEEMVHIIEYNKELQNKVNSLRRQLAQLETEDPLLQSP